MTVRLLITVSSALGRTGSRLRSTRRSASEPATNEIWGATITATKASWARGDQVSGGGCPANDGADERDGVDGSRDAERGERSDCGPAGRAGSQLRGEGVRDLGRRSEAFERVVVRAKVILGFSEDPSPQAGRDADVDELEVERFEIALDHVTTASTACANAFHSSRPLPARYGRAS